MTNLDLSNQVCASSLELLGDFHTLRIVDALSDGELRFCELQRNLDNLNPVTLTNRLKKLEDQKIVTRQQENRADVTYNLTKLGRKVLPVLDAINNFARATKNV